MKRPARRPLRALLALLAVFGANLMGASQCTGSGSGASAPRAVLDLELRSQGYFESLGHWSFVELRIRSGFPYQAFDVDFEWTASAPVTDVFIGPQSCFDDDGKLFREPDIDLAAGRASGIADLRHGADSAVIESCKAAFVVVVTDLPADVTLSVVGDVARPDGTLFDTQSATLPIAPPAS